VRDKERETYTVALGLFEPQLEHTANIKLIYI